MQIYSSATQLFFIYTSGLISVLFHYSSTVSLEIPELTTTLSVPHIHTIYAIYSSWAITGNEEYKSKLHNTSLVSDAVDTSGACYHVQWYMDTARSTGVTLTGQKLFRKL